MLDEKENHGLNPRIPLTVRLYQIWANGYVAARQNFGQIFWGSASKITGRQS